MWNRKPKTKQELLRLIKIDENGCWIWQGYVSRQGYGFIGHTGAHRLAYRLWKGEPKKWVLHTCDIKSCVNPDHLYDGTPKDNQRDLAERGQSGPSYTVSTANMCARFWPYIRES